MTNSLDKKSAPEGGAVNGACSIMAATSTHAAVLGGALETKTADAYATRSWADVLRVKLPKTEMIWGNFMLGESGAMFGPPGIGKSRLALNIARNAVLGLPFGGLPTGRRPLRHLLMGSENSIRRYQHDIQRMSAGLPAEQIALLDAHIQVATLEGPEDSYISVSSPENVERWRATLEAWPPDVLWVDPWGDALAGEANADDANRYTHTTLSCLMRKASPGASMIVLAHSRMGAKNYMTATGYDAGNYGKGSKALQAISRCAWNIGPGDESETPPVLLFNFKASNGVPYPPVALRLDAETMLYNRDAAFDFDAWAADVSHRASGKGGPRKGASPLDTYRPHALRVAEEAGKALPSGVLHERIGTAIPGGMGQKRVAALVEDCLEAGILAKTPRQKEHGGKVYIGTPEQIHALRFPKLPLEGGDK